ncbi:hypothetical protein QAD02_010492 [Eretmocerus hayati]|uniref:Uncharacterized protein n=1 Tax=Eretmocerus hayati TaxID=131215 RepID=A0ACC2NU67_9HYME|nr:hypothetical protein QAD02_010492 [Eretmocerus hayati]
MSDEVHQEAINPDPGQESASATVVASVDPADDDDGQQQQKSSSKRSSLVSVFRRKALDSLGFISSAIFGSSISIDFSDNLTSDSTNVPTASRTEIQQIDLPAIVAVRNEINVDPAVVVVASEAPSVDLARSSLRSGQLVGDESSVGDMSSTGFTDNVSEITTEIVADIGASGGVEPLSIPSAVYGVQIQRPSLGAQFLSEALVPMLFAQSSSLNSSSNARSATAEESFTTISSGVGESDGSTDSSGSSSVIEILATLNTSARRFEDEYVRPYYDLSVQPRIKKQFGRIDDDPSIE